MAGLAGCALRMSRALAKKSNSHFDSLRKADANAPLRLTDRRVIGVTLFVKINKDYKREEFSDGRDGLFRHERCACVGRIGRRARLSVGTACACRAHDGGRERRRRVLHGDHGHAR
ncbi:hypothetical protein PSP6_580111 [Paraburkholderia tropica]|nr:hypothetical protein PSP6_580111 [Paraburkholderia tropica]